MSVARAWFGRTADGRDVERFRLGNARGLEADLISYGGAVVSLRVPDRHGRQADVVLGFESLDGYVGCGHYFGAIVGRYANRIARGRFVLDGRRFELATNDGPNHLHGGRRGFDKVVWAGEPFETAAGSGVAFSYVSRDGEEGYPGNLAVRAIYTLTEADELVFEWHATTDAPTPVCLAQHSYWNLAGHGEGDVLGHELQVHASAYTPVDAMLIPTGALAAVEGTPFDFREPTPIGARIDSPDVQLSYGKGYDHNLVLDRSHPGLVTAARIVEPRSGRALDVATTEPGLHVYSGNHLDGESPAKGERGYRPRQGVCLEAQHFPDSPNRPSFPSPILRPGHDYSSKTAFAFRVVP